MSDTDFVSSLGLPLLSHRLKRASELIIEGVTHLLREEGCDAPARAVSTLLLLEQEGELGITEIAQRLRLSHPLIIRLASDLEAAGYVSLGSDAGDKRRKVVSLTASGRDEAHKLRRINAIVAEAFEQVFDEIGTDLFAAIERLESAVEAKSFADRFGAQALQIQVAPARAEPIACSST